MKKLAIVFLALWVGGCAYIQSPLNYNRMEFLIDSYGIAQSAALGYRRSCLEGTLPVGQKGCRGRVVALQGYDRAAVSALRSANDFIRANPNSDATSAIAAATAAVTAFRSATRAYGAQ